jgi:Ni,Fe-hydrogenase III large subunit
MTGIAVQAAALADDLRAAADESRLLGAYATDDDIRYVLAGRDGAFECVQPRDAARPAHAYSQQFPMLSWDEREMADERGVAFDALPDPRPLFLAPGVDPPAVVASGEGLMHFVVGPVHAGIIEPGRFTFSSGGETVVHLDAQLSFSRRGCERRLEGMYVLEAASKVARICGSCSAARSFAYARALETLAGASLPHETELARVVVAELERVYNHLADLAASAAGAGFGPGFARGMALKEEAMRLNALATGHRLLFDAIVPGGVAPGVLLEPERILHQVTMLQDEIDAYVRGLFSTASLVSRWQRAGVVEARTAKVFGAVGPASRGSRGSFDARGSASYGAYEVLSVRPAGATGGDVFARCSVKRDEIAEAIRLICAALRRLPTDSVPRALDLEIGAGSAVGLVEGPRGAETVAVHVDGAGRLTRFHAIAASYRNWPIVVKAMDGNIVPDFPLVNKSFNLCYACVDR